MSHIALFRPLLESLSSVRYIPDLILALGANTVVAETVTVAVGALRVSPG
jgi:hypothetical protein